MFDHDNLTRALRNLGTDVGLAKTAVLFNDLSQAYNGPERHYHGQAHITHCLQLLEMHCDMAEHPAEVETAVWFHDAVYDARRSDNEANSAAWAQAFLTQQQVDEPIIERIVDLILATQTHDNLTSPDQRLFIDIDLSILGQEPAIFAAYDAAIRREYAWVEEAQYIKGRTAVLQRFLERPFIYHTAPFRERYEAQARLNLTKALRITREK